MKTEYKELPLVTIDAVYLSITYDGGCILRFESLSKYERTYLMVPPHFRADKIPVGHAHAANI